MEQWVNKVSQSKIKTKIFIPDFYALPYSPGRTTLWVEKGRCLVRSGTDCGCAGSLSWITTLMGIEALKPEDMDIYADDIPSLPENWRVVACPFPQPLIERLAYAGTDGINLLQRQFEPKSAKNSTRNSWYAAAVISAFALTAHIFLLAMDTRRLEEATQRLLTQTDTLAQRTLEGKVGAANLKDQVNRYVKRIRDYQQQGGEKFWSIVRKLDSTLSTCQTCRIESLNIKNSQLDFLISSAEGFSRQRAALGELANVAVTEEELQPIQLPSGEKRQQLSVSIAVSKLGDKG